MLRLIALLLSIATFLSAGAPPDRNAVVAKLQRDLDKAISRGTPTDKELRRTEEISPRLDQYQS